MWIFFNILLKKILLKYNCLKNKYKKYDRFFIFTLFLKDEFTFYIELVYFKNSLIFVLNSSFQKMSFLINKLVFSKNEFTFFTLNSFMKKRIYFYIEFIFLKNKFYSNLKSTVILKLCFILRLLKKIHYFCRKPRICTCFHNFYILSTYII